MIPKPFPLLAVLVLLACAPIAACMPRFAAVDTGKPLVESDLALAFGASKNIENDDFAEQLLFQVVLEDGGSASVRLTVSNLASTDGSADLSVSATLGDGRKVSFRAKADRGEWTFAKDRLEVEVEDLKVVLGIGRAMVTAKSDTHELELEVSSSLPPLRPKGGLVDAGGRSYVATIAIPRGAATLRLRGEAIPVPARPGPEPAEEPKGNGEEPAGGANAAGGEPAGGVLPVEEGKAVDPATQAPPTSVDEGDDSDEDGDGDEDEDAPPIDLELHGIAYVEHRAGNIPPYEVARRWYSLIDIGETRTVVLSVFERAAPSEAKRDPQAPPGPVQGFLFAAEDDNLVLYEPLLELEPRGWANDSQTGYPLPELVFVQDPLGTFEGIIKLGPLSERKDDLARLKKLERVVVRKFMKPWTFRFERARYLFRKQDPGEPMFEVRGDKRFQIQQLN